MSRLIVPGFRGSPAGHWQRHWLDLDVTAEEVVQDDFDRPDLSAWLARLGQAVDRRPGSVLVGHSLGALLIAHFASRNPGAPVAGALLVAPADADRLTAAFPCFRSFAGIPTAPLAFPSVLVASRTDPYMRFDRAAGFAEAWGAGLVDLGDAGHVNVESGHGPWPEGFHLVDAIGTRPAPGPIAVPRAWRPLGALARAA
jgi:predicted alpha/beta hydrolase family esterase